MKKFIILLAVVGILIIGGWIWWERGTSAVNLKDTEKKFFVIPQGQGVRAIANNLQEQGLINDDIVFFLLVKQKGLDGKIQAGDFRLSPAMNALQIAEELTHGSVDIWITIPEGKRADEIADILKEKIPSYQESWRETLNASEGYLFPDTYLIPKDAEINTVVSLLKNTFNTKISDIGLTSTSSGLRKIVIIASLIEREAKGNSEKPVISGIIQNRLDNGMPLQIDATIQYAKGKKGKTYWAPVYIEEYKSVKSNYNTYLTPGLPPGPIANPGIEALRAAANPQKNSYLFYLHDKNGIIRYAETLDQHNNNINKYGL